jgi:lysophospholipid acyltransferase (LPLAT)-like uncharacterized protein
MALRLLAWTLRVRRDERSVRPLWAAGAPLIIGVWHSRALLLPYLYRGRRFRVLVSRSRDGEILGRVLARFGLGAIRGSSSRGGAEAMRELLRALRDGWGVVVVPDGPKGPPETVKPGIVTLAALSGVPIVPLAVAASAEWRMSSWDAFRIPRPFSRCVVRFGEPIEVPRPLDAGMREALRKEVEAALAAVSRRADEDVAR